MNVTYLSSDAAQAALSSAGYLQVEVLTDVAVPMSTVTYNWVSCTGKPKYIIYPQSIQLVNANRYFWPMSTGYIDENTVQGGTTIIYADGSPKILYWAYDALNKKIGFHYSEIGYDNMNIPTVVLIY